VLEKISNRALFSLRDKLAGKGSYYTNMLAEFAELEGCESIPHFDLVKKWESEIEEIDQELTRRDNGWETDTESSSDSTPGPSSLTLTVEKLPYIKGEIPKGVKRTSEFPFRLAPRPSDSTKTER
jgi:hypothetical protein